MNSRRTLKRNTKGFTLVELLVVVIIIGILSAMAIPNYVKTQEKAKESSVKSNMHTTQLAAESYCVESGGTYGDVSNFEVYLPGGSAAKVMNPFTNAPGAVENAGAPSGKGMVSYQTASSGYEIRGGGADGSPVKGLGGLTMVLQNL